MAAKTEPEKTVKIDGVAYKLSDLSTNAKKMLVNISVADKEIAHLNQQLAMFKTARAAYAKALADELPGKGKKKAEEKKAAEK